jgi:hypothetical protein
MAVLRGRLGEPIDLAADTPDAIAAVSWATTPPGRADQSRPLSRKICLSTVVQTSL